MNNNNNNFLGWNVSPHPALADWVNPGEFHFARIDEIETELRAEQLGASGGSLPYLSKTRLNSSA